VLRDQGCRRPAIITRRGAQAAECLLDHAALEAAIECDLAWAQTEPMQLADRDRQQHVLLRVAQDH
jgi:hypothetical protein